MLKVGYFRHQPGGAARCETALRSLGCQVVRSDAAGAANQLTLLNVLEFIGQGDQLVVPSLTHLGRSNQDVLELIERLDAVGASLMIVEPPMVSTGVEGHALRAALQAAAGLEARTPRQRARSVDEGIRTLHRQGVPQTEIARRLKISRMTVWRRLKELPDGDQM